MNEAKVAKLEAISELIDNEKQQVMEALAENLCTLRKVVGLTQDDLAQRVGVTRQSICHIEKTKQMTWVTALAILMIFAYNSQSAKLLPILGILEIE